MDICGLGPRLKELRLKNKLSQSQVAERIGGITSASLSSYENNVNQPSIETLSRLALLYQVSTDYLLGIDNRPTVVLDGLNKRQVDSLNTIVDTFVKELKMTQKDYKTNGKPPR